jgi:hypothetical protein
MRIAKLAFLLLPAVELSAASPFTMNGWQFHSRDVARVSEAIRKAPDTASISSSFPITCSTMSIRSSTIPRASAISSNSAHIDEFTLEMRWRLANRTRALAEDAQLLANTRRIMEADS